GGFESRASSRKGVKSPFKQSGARSTTSAVYNHRSALWISGPAHKHRGPQDHGGLHSAGPNPRDMSHLAPRTGLALAVNVHSSSSNRQRSSGIIPFGPDQVHHPDAPAEPHGLRQRPARNRPDVLLEL